MYLPYINNTVSVSTILHTLNELPYCNILTLGVIEPPFYSNFFMHTVLVESP